MSTQLIRDSLDTLLQEAYEGPPDPKETWFVSNVPESGVLGTIKHLTASQAWAEPPGIAHSVAEHVAHLIFSIDVVMRYARGEKVEANWEHSWDVGPIEEANWQGMQRTLRQAHLRMRMWVHADEPFDKNESVSGFVGAVAHAAYHLAAIRLTAAIAKQQERATDPHAGLDAPL